MIQKISSYISQINDKVISLSEVYNEGKDALLDANAIELLGDISKGIKLIHTIGKTYDIIKFNVFLRGLCKGEICKEDVEKLVSYIDNPSKAEFVAQTFKKIAMSNSKKACCILGLLYSDIVNKNNEICYETLTIYNALDEMNDIDIDVFYELFKRLELSEGNFIEDEQIRLYVSSANITKSNVEIVLQKLGQLSLLK